MLDRIFTKPKKSAFRTFVKKAGKMVDKSIDAVVGKCSKERLVRRLEVRSVKEWAKCNELRWQRRVWTPPAVLFHHAMKRVERNIPVYALDFLIDYGI